MPLDGAAGISYGLGNEGQPMDGGADRDNQKWEARPH